MKITSTAHNPHELELLREHGVSEVLLGMSQLSRLGSLDFKTLHELAKKAKALDIRPVLEWDVLMTNEHCQLAVSVLEKIDLNLFAAIRVQDVGALFVAKKLALPIQLILETGNHNLEGVKRWCEFAGSKLERVVLSIELTGNTLAHYIKNLPVGVEILGFGPILLFYTPRHLLSYQLSPVQNRPLVSCDRWSGDQLTATANAQEGFHKGFRLIENQHGTFMFHAKDYCLMDRMGELMDMNLDTLRIESTQLATVTSADAFRDPKKVTRCFFQANATDVLFKKLSNENIVRCDENFVGEVVEVEKNGYVLIHVQGRNTKLESQKTYLFTTPEGKTQKKILSRITDLDLREITEASKNDFVLIPYQKSITPKTMIYGQQK